MNVSETVPTRPIPASRMPDHELRRELADMHQLAAVVGESCAFIHRAALRARLAELDTEYLERFPQARESWPWPLP